MRDAFFEAEVLLQQVCPENLPPNSRNDFPHIPFGESKNRPPFKNAPMTRRTFLIVLLTLVSVSNADDATQQPSIQNPDLRNELVRRVKADQTARGEVIKWMMPFRDQQITDEVAFEASLDAPRKAEFKRFSETLRRIDSENTDYLKKIVDQHGWPTYTLVGKDGANAAWLLVQHADLSPKFQRKCLDLMTQIPRDEISQQDVAYLTDRVLLAEGKKQVYGTQFTLMNGEYGPRPLEDESNVDQRRKEVGLSPLAQYAAEVKAIYGGGPPKKDKGS